MGTEEVSTLYSVYVHIIYKTFQLVFRILCRMGLSDIRTCPLPLTSEVKVGKVESSRAHLYSGNSISTLYRVLP